jgi:hypothetical protein
MIPPSLMGLFTVAVAFLVRIAATWEVLGPLACIRKPLTALLGVAGRWPPVSWLTTPLDATDRHTARMAP